MCIRFLKHGMRFQINNIVVTDKIGRENLEKSRFFLLLKNQCKLSTLLTRIIMPLAKPVIPMAGILEFLNVYNELIWADETGCSQLHFEYAAASDSAGPCIYQVESVKI